MVTKKLLSEGDRARQDDPVAVASRVADELISRLDGRGSALTADAATTAQLRSQVGRVIGRTFERLGIAPDDPLPTPPDFNVGETRARQNIHPADSLTAAKLLFDVALGAIALDHRTEAEIARALNASIMENVVPASVEYVNVLLERLAVAHSEERLSISRELHDRVAHSIAAGIQRVRIDQEHPEDSHTRIQEALLLFETALEETRALAMDLRHSVGDKGLEQAIEDYVSDLDADSPAAEARTAGRPRSLPAGVQEEAFIIVREAIHNARRHSGAAQVRVTSTWHPGGIVITVEDDGVGYDRDRIRPGALGLIAAQERAELIGADLDIQTQPDAGTTVTLTIAHPRESV
ncbi:sensor histidine kinase [Leifsonia poae]|uniref:histidine kinase n=1 Tax=Leifsonia poae TaxID=110933 RepID=A0A9W6M1Z2_9MICO|nr:ATP-binding protein [Leifsonia poae]GLJ78257.1 two-component sensor histidine kinase [Leifsonia poae]